MIEPKWKQGKWLQSQSIFIHSIGYGKLETVDELIDKTPQNNNNKLPVES